MQKIILLPLLLALTGCVSFTEHKQTLTKQTIFGFQMANNPVTGVAGMIPQIQFGLVRNEFISNPTSTNPIYAAQISSDVDATLGILSQKVTEKQSFSK